MRLYKRTQIGGDVLRDTAIYKYDPVNALTKDDINMMKLEINAEWINESVKKDIIKIIDKYATRGGLWLR